MAIKQARDLIIGDTILIRAAGEIERTPHVVEDTVRKGRDVILFFTNRTSHRTSYDMPVAVL